MHSKRRRGWQLWLGDMRRPSAAPDLGPERNARLPRPAQFIPCPPYHFHAMRLSASCLCSLGCCLSFPFCNGVAACWMLLEFATVAEVTASGRWGKQGEWGGALQGREGSSVYVNHANLNEWNLQCLPGSRFDTCHRGMRHMTCSMWHAACNIALAARCCRLYDVLFDRMRCTCRQRLGGCINQPTRADWVMSSHCGSPLTHPVSTLPFAINS